MSEPSRSPAEWGEEYRACRLDYEHFAQRLRSLLLELLVAEDIPYVQVDARAKEVSSFVEKIERKPGRYIDPLVDMTDLTGLRVVVYYASDVERVDRLIEDEFAIDRDNSWRRTPFDDPERFGYRSDHFVVSCSQGRAALGEWRRFADLKAEVQVRTVLQHAWAAIDHRLNYKRESEIPVQFKRQLFQLSALLEMADDRFEAVRIASEDLSQTYEQSVSRGELAVPIDRSSIEAYIDNSQRVSYWRRLAEDAGFKVDEQSSRVEGVARLIAVGQQIGLDTLADLDAFLAAAEDWGRVGLEAVRAGSLNTWYMSSAFVLATVLLVGSDIDREGVEISTESSEFYLDAIEAARQQIHAPAGRRDGRAPTI